MNKSEVMHMLIECNSIYCSDELMVLFTKFNTVYEYVMKQKVDSASCSDSASDTELS